MRTISEKIEFDENLLYKCYAKCFPANSIRKAHYHGFKSLFYKDPALNCEKVMQNEKFILTALVLLMNENDETKIKHLLGIYEIPDILQIFENIFEFVTGALPRLAIKIYSKSEKLINIIELMQKRGEEILETMRKTHIKGDSLNFEDYFSLFAYDLNYLLNTKSVRNALMPHFLNHSSIISTMSSIEETPKKYKKKVTFALN